MPQRIWQHKNGVVEGFTKKYNVISSFTLSYSKIWQLP
ncbi:hypothetical protein ACVZHJ_11255 [Vibrio diabolicus]